ncbi:Sensor protein [Planktothrix sp. PCC 11201]|uniref:hybrid sensor histidine kinase/response regulator n=1 Tax=Planktothrix sp. PCC 11201 TaxID=1729650 RepID=UPI0009243371|nr:response regulator [Planktothrix sp. PCC 11201]SKB13652.1 Sensor protein [Planktothrix sp. PCC 11201]
MTRILVIENEQLIRDSILELLEIEEFETLSAENGKIGLQVAQKFNPDLILCDVVMPEMDGHGVLEALRKAPETKIVPFIFLTSKADKLDLRKGMELGADDYLIKPFTPKELLKAIATQLEKKASVQKFSQQKLDELRNNITHSLPHELRTPLNGILASTELLLDELDFMETHEIREIVEQISLSGKRLYRLTMNFLLYAELELIATDPKKIASLRQDKTRSSQTVITEKVMAQVQEEKREADLFLNLQDVAIAMAEMRVEKLVEELVDNAMKFSAPGQPIEINGFVKDNQFVLSVKNYGREITPQQIAQIGAHVQFERKLYEQQGSGLGLAIVQKLIGLHQGQLIIESPSDHQTLVTVYLPLSA